MCTAAAALTLAAHARAQDYTRIDLEGSTDNVIWSSNGVAALPGSTLYFRVRTSKVGPTPVAGLASLTYQPIIEFTGQTSDFSLLPFTNAATGAGAINNSGVPANLGRMLPYAASSMTTASAPGLLSGLSGIWNARSILRFSGSRNTSPTTNLAWGVQAAQATPAASGSNFAAQSSAVIFKFAVTFSATASGLYWIDAPVSLMASPDAPAARWYTVASGAGAPRPFLVDAADVHPFFVYIGSNPCLGGGGFFIRNPLPVSATPGRRVAFDAPAIVCVTAAYQWFKDGVPLTQSSRVQGINTSRLSIDPIELGDAGNYTCHAFFESLSRETLAATLSVRCPVDVDNGSSLGVRDQAVTIDDLIYFLARFEQGAAAADLDDGSSLALPDGAVTIEDLIYFLDRFERGC